MIKGKVKMFFPGGNTCLGFYSFYDNIIEPDAKRIFIIKGGPGVGKSTFMRHIGEELRDLGYDLEFHWCASDNKSLDAVVIPALCIALVDGTAPHVYDPRNPGAVEEIVNLGDYWDEAKLSVHKKGIIAANQRVARHFATAFSSLRVAKLAREEEKSYRSEGVDVNFLNRLIGLLLREIFGEKVPWGTGVSRERHLFVSALTPGGIVHYLPPVLEGINKGINRLYVVKGEPGTGKENVLQEVAELAYRCGLKCEVYHCAFDPTQVDLVVLPERKTAVLNLFPELDYDPASLPGLEVYQEYDFNSCVGAEYVSFYQDELGYTRRLFADCLSRALAYLKKAEETHGELEQYYIEAMDFEGVERMRRDVLERILAYEFEMRPNS